MESVVECLQDTDKNDLGDKFGCKIISKGTTFRADSLCHYIEDVKKNGTADQMKIKSGDQLILLNGEFMPDLANWKVNELISSETVDSKTRFSLLLLRRIQDGNWIWMDTSAILCFGNKDREVFVKDLQYTMNAGSCHSLPVEVCRLKVKGTQLFIKIADGQVLLEVSKEADKEKFNICQWKKCCLDGLTGHPSYITSLYAQNGNRLIAADEDKTEQSHTTIDSHDYVAVTSDRKVCIKNTPHWFGYRKSPLLGKSFKVEELREWIGHKTDDFSGTGKIILSATEAFFESDHVDQVRVNI